MVNGMPAFGVMSFLTIWPCSPTARLAHVVSQAGAARGWHVQQLVSTWLRLKDLRLKEKMLCRLLLPL
jgi:hypothetical protein